MIKKFVFLFLTLIFLHVLICPAAAADTASGVPETQILLSKKSSEAVSSADAPRKRNYHLEIGGSYSDFGTGDDTWKSFDARLMYNGFKKITPFGSVSRLNRDAGSQNAYGIGSYIHLHPKFYMIAGISGAPVRDPNVVLSPRLRLDLSGYYNTSLKESLVLTSGVTFFPDHNGQSGQIYSLGFINYGKVILLGDIKYSINQPGSMTSWGGQMGFMYGYQGRYYIGGGINWGKVSYQLALTTPLDVNYKSRGTNLEYTRWLGKDWGIKTRLDYSQYMVGEVDLLGFTLSFFFDF